MSLSKPDYRYSLSSSVLVSSTGLFDLSGAGRVLRELEVCPPLRIHLLLPYPELAKHATLFIAIGVALLLTLG